MNLNVLKLTFFLSLKMNMLRRLRSLFAIGFSFICGLSFAFWMSQFLNQNEFKSSIFLPECEDFIQKFSSLSKTKLGNCIAIYF